MFNAVLAKYEKDDSKEECTLFLESESDKKTMYTSELCFLKEELKKYKDEKKESLFLEMRRK